MGVIDVLKSIFKRNTALRLNEGRRVGNVVGDTAELITIDEIRRVLEDDKAYKELKRSIKEGKELPSGISCDTYRQGIRDYATFFLQRGIKLDDKVLKRANAITKSKLKNNKKQEARWNSMEVLAAKLIYAPDVESVTTNNDVSSVKDVLREFQKSGDNLNILVPVYNDLASPYELKEAIIKISGDFRTFSDVVSLNPSMIDEIGRMQYDRDRISGNEIIEKKIKVNYKEHAINEDLRKLIKSKIPKQTANKAQLAYEIYKAVCMSVQYDSGYFIKQSDKFSEDFLSRLKGRTVEELTPEKNRLICTRCSELLCCMLNEYGIDACVVETKRQENIDKDICHWHVQINLDNDVVYADATNGVIYKGLNMTDMSRVKLGLPPGNFKSIRGNDYVKMFEKKTEKDALGYLLQEKVDLVGKIMKKTGRDKEQIPMEERIRIMKQQLQKLKDANIGDFATSQYMLSIYDKIIPYNQRDGQVGISRSLYKQDAEDVYSYYPIVYIKNKQGDFSYYAYDKEQGLKKVSREEVLDKLERKELNVVVGKEHRIPGITLNYEEKNNMNGKNVSSNSREDYLER